MKICMVIVISLLLLPTISSASGGYYCHYEGKVIKVEQGKTVTVKLTSLTYAKKNNLCSENLNKEHTFNYKYSLKNIESTFFELKYSHMCCGREGNASQSWEIFRGPYMKLVKKEKKNESGCSCEITSAQNHTNNSMLILIVFLAFAWYFRFRKIL
ncbi:hypothetical protein KKF34_00790 [Myxococcota bacterium]|nr:hypothetical protein [Myxococcota bacterium]MBU1382672.1 hypothetical protein [Myxococcota bacterium]MBU1495398.1 hypothetical protein [Myxococcota bacterium]